MWIMCPQTHILLKLSLIFEDDEAVKKCVERYCELAKVATPCTDDHQFRDEENESVGELATVCSQIVLKCLFLARNDRLDILWSVNKLARAVTKWTGACDKRSARFDFIHSSHK